jgi:hypothetical protein
MFSLTVKIAITSFEGTVTLGARGLGVKIAIALATCRAEIICGTAEAILTATVMS